jgi:ABC-type Mn2+/Zn2+ transport system ATPase subunit
MAKTPAATSKNQIAKLLEMLVTLVTASTKSVRAGTVTYVIGNNGTGKSRVLSELAGRLEMVPSVKVVACIANSIYDRFKYGDAGRVKYLGARNAPNAVFQSSIDRQFCRFILQAMVIDRKRFVKLSKAVNMDFAFYLGDSEAQVRKRIEEDPTNVRKARSRIARSNQDLLTPRSLAMLMRIENGEGRFERLTTAQMHVLLRYLDLNIEIHLNVKLGNGQIIGFRELSTGEQNRALLFAKVLSTIQEGAVFLIDEPEISLHLHWQMLFHATLMDLLSGLKHFHVVVATHAPILISEAAKLEPDNQHNMVAVLRRRLNKEQTLENYGPGDAPITYDLHTFAEVASHEQLVLQYFQTAPYHAREVSAQIADAILKVAEDAQRHRVASRELLNEIKIAFGLSDEAKLQVESALELIQEGLIPSIQRTLVPLTKGAR